MKKFIHSIAAVVIVLSNVPASISSEPFEISFTITGPKAGINYVRADLYKEDTTNYFGDTYNGSEWYSGSDGLKYFPVTIDQNSSASGMVKVRLGSPSSTDYPGPGKYKLRIKRYTTSGSAATDDEVPSDIQITYTTPSPSPTLASNPTKTPSAIPSPTSSPTPTATPHSMRTLTPDDEGFDSTTPMAEVLAAKDEVSATSGPSATPIKSEKSAQSSAFPFVSVGLVCIGLGFVGIPLWPFVRAKIKDYNGRNAH